MHLVSGNNIIINSYISLSTLSLDQYLNFNIPALYKYKTYNIYYAPCQVLTYLNIDSPYSLRTVTTLKLIYLIF